MLWSDASLDYETNQTTAIGDSHSGVPGSGQVLASLEVHFVRVVLFIPPNILYKYILNIPAPGASGSMFFAHAVFSREWSSNWGVINWGLARLPMMLM